MPKYMLGAKNTVVNRAGIVLERKFLFITIGYSRLSKTDSFPLVLYFTKASEKDQSGKHDISANRDGR